jgi:hypothetical protein
MHDDEVGWIFFESDPGHARFVRTDKAHNGGRALSKRATMLDDVQSRAAVAREVSSFLARARRQQQQQQL